MLNSKPIAPLSIASWNIQTGSAASPLGQRVLAISSFMLAVLTVLSFLGQYNQFCEILSHFLFFYFVLLCACLVFACCSRMKATLAVAAVALSLNIARIAPEYAPISHAHQEGAESIRILAFNCEGKKNRHPEEIYRIASRESADVVCFSEINDFWIQRINATFNEYPYKALFSNYGGIGMVSKLPIKDSKLLLAQFRNRPRVLGLVNLKNGRTISILSVHPSIPLNAPAFEGRNQDFALYVKDLADLPGPKVIIGDFNCTPWSYYFQKLCADTGLLDAALGFGPQFSWSYRGWFIPVMPIDLCLVSPDMIVSKVKIENAAGSDHRPLLVDVWVSGETH
jgi:endonuclease/exonuclease/phosphatase (EEP) superfamily protein YafD